MEQDFLNALSSAGIPPTHALRLDGKLNHYHVQGDKKGRRNGWYRYVRVSADYAWAVFGSWKAGVNDKWSSKAGAQVTKYEKNQRIKVEREIKVSEEELRTRAAVKAGNMWRWLDWARAHSYCDRKGVGCYGLKILNGALVVPMYIDNCIVSHQYIFADGHKRFLTHGQKKGAYYWIGTESETIWVAEGYATAASVHEATGQQVVIAFDSGNLVPVIAALREKLPGARIMIAADNDQWTAGNPGYSKAQEAAAASNCEIKLPPFSYEDKARPTDWNDYHARFGIEALRRELMGERIKAVARVESQEQWRLTMIEGKQELTGFKPFDAKSKENAYLFIENHEYFKDLVAYNVFSGRIILTRCPAWEDVAHFVPRAVINRDYFNIMRALERYGIKTSKDVVEDALEAIAEGRRVNPPRDYIEGLKWDGKKRLDTWLTYYLGAEKQPAEYLALVGSKWIMGAISRIYSPGMKFDNVLILEGGQDNKKSMLFKKLTTFAEDPYFLEFSGDVTRPDSLGAMQGRIVVEMSELSSMRRAVIEEMKAFVTREIDTFRPAWGRTILERKRMFVLAATTNNDSADGYLIDPTGNRRYWPVGCGVFDMEALIADKDQLWAEALVRWRAGERTWLESDEEKQFALAEQSERQYEDSWLQPIQNYVMSRTETDVYSICREALSLSASEIKKANEDRVRNCLKKLGWYRSKIHPRTERGRITVWIKELM